MIKLSGIYKITSPSKKIYIGQSVDIIGRWNLYKKLRCKNQTYLYYSLKKYGFENPQQNKNIKNKTKKTCLEKFGVDNIFKLENIIQKRKQICLEKYGNECPLKTELGKQTIKKSRNSGRSFCE